MSTPEDPSTAGTPPEDVKITINDGLLERAEQSRAVWDTIYTQMHSIGALPPGKRRRFHKLDILCDACNEVLGRVYLTSPVMTMKLKQPSAQGWSQSFYPITDPADMSLYSPLWAHCRCGQADLGHVREWLASGQRVIRVARQTRT
jgi:hypothetical protein